MWWVVFGTLLGPGTTTPFPFVGGWVVCFWFPVHDFLSLVVWVVGVCGGVVV